MNREHVLKQSEAALVELAEALAHGRSETLVRYLEMLSRFHHYSAGNCFLIAAQRPDATHVAGFQRWKRLGRHVKQGEKGILILAPIVRTCPAADDSQDSDITELNERPIARSVRGFRAAYVFDVAQTEGQELPEFSRITGDPGEKLSRLIDAVRSRGIELVYQEFLGGADGVSYGGKIAIRHGMSPVEEFAVLVHELGHELLHRTERRKETTRKIRELEAEAVAFVVCKAAGLDAINRSADYIQLYSGDKELLMQSLDSIQKTAAEIIAAIESPEVEEAVVAP